VLEGVGLQRMKAIRFHLINIPARSWSGLAIVVATECGRLCLWVVAADPCKDSGSGFIGMKELCVAEGYGFGQMTGLREPERREMASIGELG